MKYWKSLPPAQLLIRFAVSAAFVAGIWFERSALGTIVIYMFGIMAFATFLVVAVAAVFRGTAFGEAIGEALLRLGLYLVALLFFRNEETKSAEFDAMIARTGSRIAQVFQRFRLQQAE